jgi:hypothetical protein
MASRHWKDQREKQAFLQQLREFRDETLLSQDLDPARESFDDAMEGSWLDHEEWDDFDDLDELYYGADHGDDDWEPRESIFDCRRDWDEDEPLRDLVRPGFHVRRDGQTWLVLENGRWANLLTGQVVAGSGWVDEGSIVFGGK